MKNSVLKDRALLWSGEHWIGYLRHPGQENNSASVSIWHTEYSAFGEGNVALVSIEDGPGLHVCYTDNPNLVPFVFDNVIHWEVTPFDRSYPVAKANMSRCGETNKNPGWIIHDGTYTISIDWAGVRTPFIMEKPEAEVNGVSVSHSLLFFCEDLSVNIDGEYLQGHVFEQERWASLIGKSGTSAVYALAETMCRI